MASIAAETWIDETHKNATIFAMPKLFKKKRLLKKIEGFEIPDLEAKLEIVKTWHRAHTDGSLKSKTESQSEQAFNQAFFEDVLGYIPFPAGEYTIEPKANTEATAQKPDAVLAHFTKGKIPNRIAAVVEIKDVNVPIDRPQKRANSETPIQQGFRYKTQYKQCDFVIVTNFQEIRLFKDNQLDYEKWTLESLIDPKNEYQNFRTFYYLLCAKNLLSKRGKSKTESLLSEIRIEQDSITKKFYGEYKALRQDLIKNIVKNNEEAQQKEKFYELAVEKSQKIIDRIVFVAFCEDLDLLPEHTLMTVIKHAQNSFSGVWDMLKGFFNAVDTGSVKLGIPNGFNGELFKPDTDLNNLKIDDEICEKFLNIGAYDFSEDLSVNILGHIFEQSISDLEELKAIGEEAEVDKKKSKRKKDGIFYTPEYIVDYIVKNSVGAYLAEKEKAILAKHKVKEDLQDKNYEKRLKEAYREYRDVLQNIKVLDPACGSGAFLVNVFDFLLAENKRVGEILGDLFNSESYFRSILQNNIYGVDLNPESVEITKLSLWLKTAEKGKKLTTLKNNIKCGNSLIDDPSVAGDKAFNWNEEFKDIINKGGFDVVVGNPPYGVDFSNEEKGILKTIDKDVPDFEIYYYFISHGANLLKSKGILSYIFPNTFLSNMYGKNYREKILKNNNILSILDLSDDNTFVDASVRTCVFTFKTQSDTNNTKFETLIGQAHDTKIITISHEELEKQSENWMSLFHLSPQAKTLVEKLQKITQLRNFFDVSQGYIPYRRSDLIKKYGNRGDSIVDNREWHSTEKLTTDYKPELQGKQLMWYYNEKEVKSYIKYGKHVASYVDPVFFESPRISFREIISTKILATYMTEPFYTNPSIINAIQKENGNQDLKYALALVNSTLLSWYHSSTSPKAKKGLFPKILVNDVRNLPIPQTAPEEQQPFIEKADQMLELNKKLHDKKARFQKLVMAEYGIEKWGRKLNRWWDLDFAEFTKTLKLTKLSLADKDDLMTLYEKYKSELDALTQKINSTDKEIDEMVFDLYGLTEDERKVVLNEEKE